MRISRQSIEKVLYRRLIRIMLRILTLVVILLLPLCSLSSLSEAKVTGEEIYNKTLESTQIYNDTQLQEYIRSQVRKSLLSLRCQMKNLFLLY